MPDDAFNADEAAAHLLKWRRAAILPIAFPPDLRPRTVADGYAIQSQVIARARGSERPGGYKVACTTIQAQQRFGITAPVCAPIPLNRIQRTGAEIAGLNGDTAFECEIAVRLECDGDDVRVGGVHPALEVIQQRYETADPDEFPSMLADGLYNAGCVLGQEAADWRTLDLGSITVRASIDDVVVATATVGGTVGDPLRLADALVETVRRRGGPLEDGFVVITGSITGEHWLGTGQRFTADFEGLGVVSARFV